MHDYGMVVDIFLCVTAYMYSPYETNQTTWPATEKHGDDC